MTPRRLVQRGQAIGIARFFAVLIGISLVYTISKPAVAPIRNKAANSTTNGTVQTGVQYTATVYDNFLVIALFVSVIGLVALAVYQGQEGP